MSLSFVSKTVQTTTEGGDFVEEAIVGKGGAAEDTALGGTHSLHKPLFEQLRDNQEQADAEREEYQKAMMRGTLALDEEDVAHLEGLQRKKREQQDAVHRQTEQELAAFRVARAERSAAAAAAAATDHTVQQDNLQSTAVSQPSTPTEQTAKVGITPQIRIKRKRRKEEHNTDATGTDTGTTTKQVKTCANLSKRQEDLSISKEDTSPSVDINNKPASTLGLLLTGYGSSSSEDDEDAD